VPVLLDHDELLVRRYSDDVDPIDTVDDKEIMLLARARRDFYIRPEGENPEITKRARIFFWPGFDHRIYDLHAPLENRVSGFPFGGAIRKS
jgi:hypothetical protein